MSAKPQHRKFCLRLKLALLCLGSYWLLLTPHALPAQTGHKSFSLWLKQYVDPQGNVDYTKCKKNPQAQQQLNTYLDWLKQNPPSASAPKSQRLAFWINLYNAATIRLVLDHYPVESIRDIEQRTGKSPWEMKTVKVKKKTYTLNEVEHTLIRPVFKDPRVHFALVCAAKSCPKLLNEAYTAQRLNSQLDAQARYFLNRSGKNQLSTRTAAVSKIFEWFEKDFLADNNTLTGYLNQYAAVKINPTAHVSYLHYDWSLNEK